MGAVPGCSIKIPLHSSSTPQSPGLNLLSFPLLVPLTHPYTPLPCTIWYQRHDNKAELVHLATVFLSFLYLSLI